MIEGSIRTYLLTKTDITDLIGTRMYYLRSPEIVTYPYVAFYNVSNPEERQEIGLNGSSPIMSFKIVTKSAVEMVNISNAIRAELQDLRSVTLSGDEIYFITKIGSRDLVDDRDMEDIVYYVRTDDYEIAYNL